MNFDAIAPYYDQLARFVFGRQIARSQLSFLDEMPKGAKVLVAGGGTGWILQEVVDRICPGEIIYIEPSAEMMRRSREKWSKLECKIPVTFLETGLEELQGSAPVDILLLPFVLDLFSTHELNLIGSKIDGWIRPGGYCLFADFQIPRGWKAPFARLLIGFMYRFFDWTSGLKRRSLPDFSVCFPTEKYEMERSRLFAGGLIRSVKYRRHL